MSTTKTEEPTNDIEQFKDLAREEAREMAKGLELTEQDVKEDACYCQLRQVRLAIKAFRELFDEAHGPASPEPWSLPNNLKRLDELGEEYWDHAWHLLEGPRHDMLPDEIEAEIKRAVG